MKFGVFQGPNGTAELMESFNSGPHLRCPEGRDVHTLPQEKELPEALLEALK